MEINTSITRPCVVLQRATLISARPRTRTYKDTCPLTTSYTVKGALHR